MIVEWLITVGTALSAWFASLWPDFEAPAFLTDFDTQVNAALGLVGGAAVWADWAYVLSVVGVVVGVWVITLSVKVILKIASFIPFFGGTG